MPYFYEKHSQQVEDLHAPQLQEDYAFNVHSLSLLNEALQLYQAEESYSAERARDVNCIVSGYKITKRGKPLREFEFDSKSYNNLYYAFMHRHNANVVKPDP